MVIREKYVRHNGTGKHHDRPEKSNAQDRPRQQAPGGTGCVKHHDRGKQARDDQHRAPAQQNRKQQYHDAIDGRMGEPDEQIRQQGAPQ